MEAGGDLLLASLLLGILGGGGGVNTPQMLDGKKLPAWHIH